MATIGHRRSVRAVEITIFVCLTLRTAAPTSADIAGKWRIDESTGATVFVDVAQDGDAVSVQLDGFSFAGALSQSLLQVTDFTTVNRSALHAIVSPDERQLRGAVVSLAVFPLAIHLSGERCTCFDGNNLDGDGCNTRCQIEECFICETDSCRAAGDGAPCDNGNVCTAGETCSNGQCNAGSPVTPCFDLSGAWRAEAVLTDPIDLRLEYAIRFRQTGRFLEASAVHGFGADGVLAIQGFGAAYAGSIDPATGMFDLHRTRVDGIGIVCNEMEHAGVSGRVSADGVSLTGQLTVLEGPPPSCATFREAVTAHRCGAGDEPCVSCPGDCNRDGVVTVDELVSSVGITLATQPLSACVDSDTNVDEVVTVDELVTAVRSLLTDCPQTAARAPRSSLR